MTAFSDDFNRSDSTNLGAGWVEVSGDWSIVSNRLSSGSAGGTIILRAAGAMATNDHSAQVTIATTAAVSHGLWIRGNSNISQGYLFRNDGSSWNLFSVVGGSFTSIGTYAAAAVSGDVAKIQAVGSTIKCFVNGTQRISVTDTNVTTGTSVGLRAESVAALRFDDFSAADVSTGTTIALTPAVSVEAAQALAGQKTAPLSAGAAVETAQPLTGVKTAILTPVTVVETAQTLTGAKTAVLGGATAVEDAQPPAGSKTAALNTATSAEAGQDLTGTKTAVLTPAIENTAAQVVTGSKLGVLEAASTVDTAQTLTPSAPATTLPTADTIEAARPLTGFKTFILTPAIEVYTARPVARQSTVVPSPQRTAQIPAEHRSQVVAAEQRLLVVAAEGRTLTVR